MENEYIRSCIDPASWNVSPVPQSMHKQTSFPKRFDIHGEWTVNDLGKAVHDVKTNSGAVLWLPLRGIITAIRVGIVPDGRVDQANLGVGTNGLAITSLDPIGMPNPTLTWVTTPLPYSNTFSGKSGALLTSNQTVDVQVGEAMTFSMARLLSGILFINDASVPIGNIQFKGDFNASSVQDIRTVFQTYHAAEKTGGNSGWRALDSDDLQQFASTEKDKVKKIPYDAGGVMALVGDAINPELEPPIGDHFDEVRGQMQRFPGTGFYTATPVVPFPPLEYVNVNAAWITPWNATLDPGVDPATGVKCQHIQFLGGINPCGSLDISMTMQIAQAVPVGGFIPIIVNIASTHVFATCSPDGSVNYTCHQESSIASFTIGTSTLNCCYSTSAQKFHAGMVQRREPTEATDETCTTGSYGMYIGTYVLCSLIISGPIPGASLPAINYVHYDVRARNMYSVGELGSCRILKYDNFSDHQRIRVDGVFHVQASPGAKIAPFVQTLQGHTTMDSGRNQMEVLSAIFNAVECPVKRVDSLKAYKLFLMSTMTQFSPQMLDKWMDEASHPVIAENQQKRMRETMGSVHTQNMLYQTGLRGPGTAGEMTSRLQSLDQRMVNGNRASNAMSTVAGLKGAGKLRRTHSQYDVDHAVMEHVPVIAGASYDRDMLDKLVKTDDKKGMLTKYATEELARFFGGGGQPYGYYGDPWSS